MKNLLLNLFGSLPFGAIWSKAKFGLLVLAVSFMFWQGLQMTSLRKDVSNLETIQTRLQEQVQQVEANYNVLQANYQLSAKTSEQYIDSVETLRTKSTELEKSFASLEKRSQLKGTTPREVYEKRPTATPGTPGGQLSTATDGGDAEWRKLLNDTYCQVQPSDAKCIK